jgi:hypothetical protein
MLILVLRAIPENHTDVSLPKCALVIANVFTIEAAGKGTAFFNLFAQGLNQLSVTGGQFNVKSLRLACFAYANVNEIQLVTVKVNECGTN